MKKILLWCSTICLATTLSAQTQLLLPEQPVTIKIGNERDGFMDSTTGYARTVNGKLTDNQSVLPFLARVPEQNKIIYTFGGGWKPYRLKVLESTDNGKTWQDSDFGNFVHASALGLSYYGNGVFSTHQGAARSTDYGKTWTNTNTIYLPRYPKIPLVGWANDYVFPDSNGQHILSAFYANRNFSFPEAKQTALFRESFDAGKTWSEFWGCPELFGANEVAFCDNDKGEIIAAIRATTLMAPSNDQGDRLETAISKDGGKTWSAPKVVAGNGRHHPSMVRLPDGRIVMTYVVRMGYPDSKFGHNYGVEAVISYDGGYTWDTDHRYVLDSWCHSGFVTDEHGKQVQVEQFWAAPQTTSTVYLPETGEILTAYMTAKNLSRKDGRTRECVLLKWKPIDNYSKEKAPRPAPVPVEQALKELRSCPFWAINYVSSIGRPDGGWIQRYPSRAVNWKNGKLTLTHDADGTYSFRGVDLLEFMTGTAYLRMKIKLLPEPGNPGQNERLTVQFCLGNGQDKYQVVLFLYADFALGGTFGRHYLPVKNNQEFLLEMHMDPLAQRVRIWINGKILHDGEWIVSYAPPELPAQFYFGRGTPRVSGKIQVNEVRLGHKPY